MRTTLTIDDDVTAMLEQLRKTRSASLKDLINEALRRELRDMATRPKPRALSELDRSTSAAYA